ncbi:hypothetical protein EPIR_1895 [Erwinia piriflorinigrans CFBP 5888]|uniref:Uncharacterized protein n=1 Tax=Erwinia piriflorinigrans CFBP 5888 TaxID=1161919 RepID=V5Z8H9_9GAMM|nr:hypothetical protein EPIR_1895 [Erwinia piriflorinigrans CFBP 5888]
MAGKSCRAIVTQHLDQTDTALKHPSLNDEKTDWKAISAFPYFA